MHIWYMVGIHFFSDGLAIQPQSSTLRGSCMCYSTVCPRKGLYAAWCAKAHIWVLKHSHATVGINQFARCAAQVAIPWTDPTRAVGNQYGMFTCVWPNPAVHTTQRDTYNVDQHIKKLWNICIQNTHIHKYGTILIPYTNKIQWRTI